MKKVLFIGSTDYNLNIENATLHKKFTNLSQDMEVYVLARGQEAFVKKYNCEFYFTPKIFLPIWYLMVFLKALKLIYKKNIDTIISQSPALDGFTSALLKTITKRELIIEVHGDWVNSLFFYYQIPFAKIVKNILIFCGKFSLARADKIRVISGFTERLVKQYVKIERKIYQFPTFSDIDIFLNEIGTSYEKKIVFVGVLYRLKGVHFLIEAFSRLQNKFPDWELLIIGDGPYRQELDKLIDNLKVKNVIFTGRLDAGMVKEKIKNSSILVLPSLSEGLGRVLIEAALLRKALVGSNVDGIPDIIHDGENGFLFKSGDVADLQDKLERLVKDENLIKVMGEKGRKIMEMTYSTAKYFAAYRDMVNEKI